MRHICLYIGVHCPDFHCAGAGPPEVVQEALADLKIDKNSFVTTSDGFIDDFFLFECF